jgi:UDP-N-acetylmuramoylalanine--D-glutamate ligase
MISKDLDLKASFDSPFSLNGKAVIVVGLGASGLAAIDLCLERGARVTAADAKSERDLGETAKRLLARGVKLAVGGHANVEYRAADLVVVSPGVPSFAELESAEKMGTEVIGEIELAVRALVHPAPIIAIGGTNGKSTTTSLVSAMASAAGMRTFAGGNLGEPFARHVSEKWDAIVLEVSSFQMERAPTFAPRVAVLLNVTADHLDRYPDIDAYARAKGNAFANQSKQDFAIVPFGDDVCIEQARRGKGELVTFGEDESSDVVITRDAIVDRRTGDRYALAESPLSGAHNASNLAAAITSARAIGVDRSAILAGMRQFQGLPHRMALVATVANVRYYDDSKGTNVGAAVTALRGISESKAVLIAGGRDKGGSYESLAEALRDKGRGAVLIGEAADAIARAIGNLVPIVRASSLEDAVARSAQMANPGDAVLLSPACSSYDMFRDYKERGAAFARAVQALAERSDDAASQYP